MAADDVQSRPGITIDLTIGETIDLTSSRDHEVPQAAVALPRGTSVDTGWDTQQSASAVRPWPLDTVDQWYQTRAGRLTRRFRLLRIVLSRPQPAPTEGHSLAVIHRSLDVVLGSVLLVLLAPVMAAVAATIKLSSRGPVFFRQERFGRAGRTFCMWKFRSMVVNADHQIEAARQAVLACNAKTVDAPTFKSKEDPRVTRVGRFLRRSGIDELPQLFNVLVGEMSLVGPRPLVAVEVEMLSQEATSLRHAVRPGITCLWQVMRDEGTTFSERMQLDLLYVRRRSVGLDLAIVATTPFALVRGRGTC